MSRAISISSTGSATPSAGRARTLRPRKSPRRSPVPGIADANVYGVAVPGTEGRAGMAAIVLNGAVDLAALRSHLIERLPAYARPLFLRVRSDIDVTAPSSTKKAGLPREGYDPAESKTALYFDDPARQTFVPLDAALYDDIQRGANSRCDALLRRCAGVDGQHGAGDIARRRRRADTPPRWPRRRLRPAGAKRCAARPGALLLCHRLASSRCP